MEREYCLTARFICIYEADLNNNVPPTRIPSLLFHRIEKHLVQFPAQSPADK